MNTEVFAEPTATESAPDIGAPLPTQDDLPYDDGVPMESERHRLQMDLMIHALKPRLDQLGDGYVGGNMFVYFSLAQVRHEDFRGPDVFVVKGVPQKERKSWVVWEEGKAPDVVIELLSESTAKYDKTTKKTVYQDQLRVPEYFWFDPFNPDDLAGFALRDGKYEPLPQDAQGRLISTALGLLLVRWRGTYTGVETVWLRWATMEGELLLTDKEAAQQRADQEKQRARQAEEQSAREKQRAEQEKQRARQAEEQSAREKQRAEQEKQRARQAEEQSAREKQRAEQEKQRAEKLAAKLRAMGVDPEELLE